MTRRFSPYIGCLLLASILSALSWPVRSEPRVLVQVTSLRKGSLPRIVTAYGRVDASSSARRTVMAPLSAVVDEVYVRPGEEVAKDAPLIRLVPGPKTAASYAQANSALHVASQLVDRTRKMVEQHLATGQQLADAEKSLSDAHATLAALQAQGAGGPDILRAPFDAIVTGLSISPGAIVTEGSALVDLARREGLILKVGVIPGLVQAIAPGNEVSITPIGEHVFSGKVLSRGSVVDLTTGLVAVEISLLHGKGLPGEMAEAAITTGEVRGYVVPHEAILVDDQGKPYVVQAVNMIARKIAVRVLGAYGGEDVIEGQLDVAAPVVLAGNHQLDDGMKVRLADPKGTAAQ